MNKECEKFENCKVKEITKLPFGLIATFCPDTCKHCYKDKDICSTKNIKDIKENTLKKVA